MPQPEGQPVLCPRAVVSVLLACSLLSACASRPTPDVTQPQAAEPPPLSAEQATPAEPPPAPVVEPVPDPEPDPLPCAWSKIRGIAKLLAIAESPPQRGTWQFFPGDEVVFHPAPEQASTGDEFKALLRRPMSGNCEEPELVLFGPV